MKLKISISWITIHWETSVLTYSHHPCHQDRPQQPLPNILTKFCRKIWQFHTPLTKVRYTKTTPFQGLSLLPYLAWSTGVVQPTFLRDWYFCLYQYEQNNISHPHLTFLICTSVQTGLGWCLPALQNRYSDQYNWASQMPAWILLCFTSCPHFQTFPEVIPHSLLPENGTKSIKILSTTGSQSTNIYDIAYKIQPSSWGHKPYDGRNLRPLTSVQNTAKLLNKKGSYRLKMAWQACREWQLAMKLLFCFFKGKKSKPPAPISCFQNMTWTKDSFQTKFGSDGHFFSDTEQ